MIRGTRQNRIGEEFPENRAKVCLKFMKYFGKVHIWSRHHRVIGERKNKKNQCKMNPSS